MTLPRRSFIAIWMNDPNTCAKHGYNCNRRGFGGESNHDPNCINRFETLFSGDHDEDELQEVWDDLILRFGQPDSVSTDPLYLYEVEGRGSFPFDMLRYDQAILRNRVRADEIRDQRIFQVVGLSKGTVARWNSFGWGCSTSKKVG